MKIGRIMGFVLSIVLVLLLGHKNIGQNLNNHSFELVNGKDNVISEGTIISKDDSSQSELYVYENNSDYEITLSEANIVVNCEGSGENKEHDEYITKNNLDIYATFSSSKSGLKSKEITIKPNSKAYIFINSKYSGDETIYSDVDCNYTIALSSI